MVSVIDSTTARIETDFGAIFCDRTDALDLALIFDDELAAAYFVQDVADNDPRDWTPAATTDPTLCVTDEAFAATAAG